MSADLFAAFGHPVKSETGSNYLQPAPDNSSPGGQGAYEQTESSSWILQSQPIPQTRAEDSKTALWKQDSQGVEVLFDASDTEQVDDDDFGEFESVPTQAPKLPVVSAPTHESVDLLGLDTFSNTDTLQSQSPSTLIERHKDSTGDWLGVSEATSTQHVNYTVYQSNLEHSSGPLPTSSNRSQDALSTQQSEHLPEDDDWGDFEDTEAAATRQAAPEFASKPTRSKSEIAQPDLDDDDWEVFDDGPLTAATSSVQPIVAQIQQTSITAPSVTPQPTTSATAKPRTQPRPTNVPPPSTLLQLLPQIYTTLSTHSRRLDPSVDLARQTLRSYMVTCRLISGRQLRWKRDTILSQSTRISQAGLKNTGMKLTALDKSSTIKEDQDVQEAISVWQRHAATLNVIMLKAPLQKPPMSLSSNMAVRSVSGPGVLTARECCAVCGLKRNERVVGIDVKVEDTFGEFWVEHWGHRDCFEFWYAHEGLLSRR